MKSQDCNTSSSVVIGVNIGKDVFHLVGFAADGKIAFRRRIRRLGLRLSANFVLMPLASLGLAAALRLDEPLAEGLLLLGMASGAPLIPNLVGLAKGSLPLAVGIMILLTAGTLVYLPLILPLFLPGVIVGSLSVARPLLLFMLLPLAIGVVLKAYREDLAAAQAAAGHHIKCQPGADSSADLFAQYRQSSPYFRFARHYGCRVTHYSRHGRRMAGRRRQRRRAAGARPQHGDAELYGRTRTREPKL
jgi:hypothetical protein